MQKLWPDLLLPVLELATAWWLVRRITYKRYPMLLAYLVTEAVCQVITLSLGLWPVRYMSPLRMAIRACVVFEVFYFGCIHLSKAQRLGLTVWATTVSAACVTAVAFAVRLEAPSEFFFVFRQYFHLILAAALVGLTVYIFRNPVLENRDHRVYRYFMTLNMIRVAIGALFVKGGFGYLLLPYGNRTWLMIDRAMWISATILIPTMGYLMSSNISCLRPDVAYRDATFNYQLPERETAPSKSSRAPETD
jgi:hypothetical protein